MPYSLISASIFAPFAAGLIATLLKGCRKSIPEIPGLLFHSVLPRPGFNMSHFSLTRFRKLMQLISSKSIKTLTLSEANRKTDSVENGCLLTFDDGMECVYTDAYPILNEFNFKATIFCIAGFTGKHSSWDIFNGQHHLSVGQIKQLSDSGHEIGSHTLTHAHLIFLNDEDLEIELKESKHILEDITGRAVNTLSFPYGSWNMHVWRKAQEAGYTSATLYRNHICSLPGLYPVYGVYRFSKPEIIMNLLGKSHFSPTIATAILMSHFSKGTPIVKFRRNYTVR